MTDLLDRILGEESSEDYNPGRVAIRMDVLENIIKDLNENKELKKIFGNPVSRALAVVADNNDLRVEVGEVDISEKQERKFLEILEETIARYG